jgi:hypothetical protein
MAEEADQLAVTVIPTTPFEGQKPGTSGLRKKVAVVSEGYYLQNFVQSIFNALPAEELTGSTLVVSGDGRCFLNIVVNLLLTYLQLDTTTRRRSRSSSKWPLLMVFAGYGLAWMVSLCLFFFFA